MKNNIANGVNHLNFVIMPQVNEQNQSENNTIEYWRETYSFRTIEIITY